MDFCFYLVCLFYLVLLFIVVVCLFTRRRRRRYNHFSSGYCCNIKMSNIVHNLMERLRSLVGFKGWDYCVLWKLSDDQRFIEWMDCCCGGSEQNNMMNGGDNEEVHFPVSPILHCRDVAFHQHPRSKSCELLAQLATSMPFDSGNMYTQTLISNQFRWLNLSNNINSDHIEEVCTRVLVPIMGGLLIELFVTKQVPEDQNVIDFITTQCSISLHDDHQVNTNTNTTTTTNIDQNPNLFPPPISLSTTLDNLEHVPYDISIDRIRLSTNTNPTSPMNLLHQFYTSHDQNINRTKNDHVYFDGSSNPNLNSMIHNRNNVMDVQYMEHEDPQGGSISNVIDNDKDSFNKHENNVRSDSVSDCSDQIDEEDDGKYRRRANGKGPHSKNLVAERKRRKKLNDRLYALRALVPKISKLDRASILGDAIEFVKELQKQAKELQDELEEHSDNDGPNNNNIIKSENFSQNGTTFGPKTEPEHLKSPNGFHIGNNIPKSDIDVSNDKTPQMEVQVEVAQLDGNKFFVKVFCEHKAGGFVKLMEALNSLGLEVTDANVTSCRGLVSNVFKVVKRDSEMVQADHVRDSLLELTRNPNSREWSDQIGKSMEGINGNGNMEYHHNHHHHHHHDHHLHNNHHVAAHHHFHHLHT